MIWRRLFFCTLFLCLLLAVRLPFLSNQLVGEEGDFAFLIANPTPSAHLSSDGLPNNLIGNLDGDYLLNKMQHPILPYLFLEDVVGSFVRPMDVLSQAPTTRIVIVRSAFLALFLIGAVGLAWLAAASSPSARLWGFFPAVLIPLYALTTPLAVGGSLQPQVDGGFGVMLNGIAAALLLPAPGRGASRWRFLLAGTLVGLGRAEWTLGFGAAAAIVMLCARSAKAPRDVHVLCLALLGGLAIGLAIAVAASPADYWASFAVAERVFNLMSPWDLARRDLRYVVPVCIFLCVIAFAIAHRFASLIKEAPGPLIAAVSGSAIFAGFATSGWPGDGFPRYYAPALTLCAYCATWLYIAHAGLWPIVVRGGATLLLLAGLAWNAQYLIQAREANVSITSSPGLDLTVLNQRYAAAVELAKPDGPLPLVGAGIWLTYPHTNFFAEGMGYPGALAYLGRKYPDWVKRLMPPQ